ncbi:MAG: hypothetical protein IPK83_02125 [Planctomycetes bacterium]|nr:hypothetical protein [Planctomycetota bacterium]
MSISKLFPTLSKTAPGWLTWGLIVVLLFGCAAFYIQARDIRREIGFHELMKMDRTCERVKAGDSSALIQLMGILASGESPHFVIETVAKQVEGISEKGDPQEVASFIAGIYHLLRRDPRKGMFVWTKESLAQIEAVATTHPTR